MKIYVKHGKLGYKEKRMIEEITAQILKKQQAGEELHFKPASNLEELTALHERFCTIDVAHEEVGSTSTAGDASDEGTSPILEKHRQFRDQMAQTATTPQASEAGIIDPLSSQEPIVRDYVMEETMNRHQEQVDTGQTVFNEPETFDESFRIPEDNDEGQRPLSGGGGGNKSGPSQPRNKSGDEKKSINPQFDEMSSSRKKRSTKKMAKLIVEAVIMLAEKGCIWWSTKDITEEKLVQYELDGEIDLSILISLENNQQAPIRDWFVQQRVSAEDLFKVSDDDKNDLIDSLFEVMLEKGIAPTPMQELIINAVKTFVIDMGLKAFMLQSQISAVLSELKAQRAGNPATAARPKPERPPEASAAPVDEEEVYEAEVLSSEVSYPEAASDANFTTEFPDGAVGSFEEQDAANTLVSG